MLAIQSGIAKYHFFYTQGAVALQPPDVFLYSPVIVEPPYSGHLSDQMLLSLFCGIRCMEVSSFVKNCILSMSHSTRTESIGPKLGYSCSDLGDVVNSVCN